MATVNLVQIDAMQVVGTSDPRRRDSTAQLPAYPVAPPANHEITVAAKIALHSATRAVGVSCIVGAIYAISGVEADDNIAVGGGFYCPAGQVVYVPVRPDDTRLLVVEAA